MWQFLGEEMRNNLVMKHGGRIGTRTAACCRGPGDDLPDNRIYGLSGLIWTGAQQQRVYDDLIRQTKRRAFCSPGQKRGRKWKCTENEGFSGGITGTKAEQCQRW